LTKCFSCSNEAIAEVNTCSPTSSSSLTPTNPRCATYIVHMIGPVNMIRWLVPRVKARAEFREAVKRRAERIERLAREQRR